MSDSFTLDGTEYELTGNPSLGTVRAVQSMQMDMIMKYVDEEQLEQLDSIEDEGEIIGAILDSGGYESLQDVMWEKSLLEPLQTISLAVDEIVEMDEVEEIPALEFKEIREKSEEALDGDASDFFNRLGIGSFLNEEEMERRAVKQAQNET